MVELCEREKCTGCQACVSACHIDSIAMEQDKEGFWYPKINAATCVSCGACQRSCPILNKSEQGTSPKIYACWNKDDKVREQSSSGGAFTLLADYCIDNGGVVFGACYDKSMQVIHSYAETKDDIAKFRGSKYVQSYIGDSFKKAEEFLKMGRMVLFTGTPCQIGGLYAFLGKRYEKLISVDIICHGVPSPKVFAYYIKELEQKEKSKVVTFKFRDKRTGWRRFSVTAGYENGSETVNRLNEDYYLKLFRKDISLRPSCYDCSFKTMSRISDITIADFWGANRVIPEWNDDKGISLFFFHNKKGKRLFLQLSELMETRQINRKQALIRNSVILRSVKRPPIRDYFFENLDKMPLEKLTAKCFSQNTKSDRPFFVFFEKIWSKIHSSTR